jgi:putative oxidoreductase
MNVVTVIARVLLGLIFIAAGSSAFVFTTPPPLPGLAGEFNDAFVHSHWSMFVAVAQLAAGVLLIANRYVTIALIILGAFLYNSLAFHLTMMPAGLPAASIVLTLWLFLSWRNRERFAQLLREPAATV